MMWWPVLVLAFVICPFSAVIAAEEGQVSPVTSLSKNAYKTYISASYENDMIGGGEDQFYTSGLQPSYFNVGK